MATTNTNAVVQDAEGLIRALDAVETTPQAVQLRAHTYDLLQPTPGTVVVDVGCGTARAVAELSHRGVHAIGVDTDPTMLAAAHQRFPDIDVRTADATHLPFDDGQLHGYRADKVYHLLDDPAAALAEGRRVLAPGGRIVLLGQDWDTFIIESDQSELTRTIVHARAEAMVQPRVARAYRNLLLDAGFHDVTVEVRTAVFTDTAMLPTLTRLAEIACQVGAVSRDQADGWAADQAARARAGRALFAIPLFVVAGTR
jgi:ubiquinone/menaquinone biosynthesis C-methylase UbiE